RRRVEVRHAARDCHREGAVVRQVAVVILGRGGLLLSRCVGGTADRDRRGRGGCFGSCAVIVIVIIIIVPATGGEQAHDQRAGQAQHQPPVQHVPPGQAPGARLHQQPQVSRPVLLLVHPQLSFTLATCTQLRSTTRWDTSRSRRYVGDSFARFPVAQLRPKSRRKGND